MIRKHIYEIKAEKIDNKFPQKRDCYKELKDYVLNKNNSKISKILALYGLRRTGKSTMLEQLSIELEAKNKPFKYYYCGNNATFSELENNLNEDLKNNIGIVFIDEATMIKDLIENSAILADYYNKQGMKIVLSGTDSLSLMFAGEDNLYDRISYIHTSYISFGEFHRLLNKNIDDYIKYGGTLTASPYKNEQSTKEYENTAIVNNILHSIENSEGIRPYPPALTELYSNNEIVSEINKMISKLNQYVTLKAIKKDYTSAGLKQSINNIKRQPPHRNYNEYLNVDLVDQKTKKALEVLNKNEMKTTMSQTHLDELKNYLKTLNLLLSIPVYNSLKDLKKNNDIEILMQPGMVYAHSTILRDELLQNENWVKELGISDKQEFIKRTERIIFGYILENNILANTYINFSNKNTYISKLTVPILESVTNKSTMHEIDMIAVTNNKSYLFEIKSSNLVLDDHEKHLTNDDFINYINENFGNVNGKYVIYSGENYINDKNIIYINSKYFLEKIYENKNKSLEYTIADIKNAIENKIKNEISNNKDIEKQTNNYLDEYDK